MNTWIRIGLFGYLLMTGLQAGAQVPSASEKTDEELSAWLDTSLLLSRERADWKTAQAMLNERLDLLQSELASIRQRMSAAEEEGGRTSDEIKTLEAEKAALAGVSSNLQETVSRLEGALRVLLSNLPAPIQERVRPLSQRLPADPARSAASTGERFQNVVGILNEVSKFAREVTLASEVRDLTDGSRVEVTSVYLGIGQAYYVNPERGIAGVGRPGTNGWVWTSQPELVPDVQRAIAIYRNEQPAAYVRLPLAVRNPQGLKEATP